MRNIYKKIMRNCLHSIVIIYFIQFCNYSFSQINPLIPLQIQPIQIQNPLIQMQQFEAIRAQEAQRRFYEDQLAQQQRDRAIKEQKEQAALDVRDYEKRVIADYFKAAQNRASLYPDFEKVVFANDVVITIDMIKRMSNSFYAADIAYYLGTNKDEAYKISKLSWFDMGVAVANIEEKLKIDLSQKINNTDISPASLTGNGNINKIPQRLNKRIALVIGNANYANGPLKNPINDATDISVALKLSGFEVIDQRNASLIDMTRAIRQFGDKLLNADVGLVYFSGHGIEAKGRNYLIPVNATMLREDEIAFQSIDANLILEKMNTANKSVNILIIDACRDNPFTRSFRGVNKGLAQMDAPAGTIVAFATSPGKTAADGIGRNSPFTRSLVQAMKKANTPIEAVFKEVRKNVVEETKGQQTPWESSSLIGDFYFTVSK